MTCDKAPCRARQTTTTPTTTPSASSSLLPRRLQELREAIGLSMYALWLNCGVSRDTISRIEGGDTIPGVHVLTQHPPASFTR
jgi:hypothetical protein